LNALIEQGEDAFLAPLTVTSDRTIIDGYARWELARLQNRSTVECIEYDLSESEALHRLLLSHRPSPGFVPFNRILLALRLESHFRQRARQNQQAGGRNKELSKLTEAERANVRKQIANAAGVSVGTLHHVTQLLRTADPAVRQALQDAEIKIHRAWRWSKEPREVQKELLAVHRRKKGMAKVAEKLVASHSRKCPPTRLRRCPGPASHPEETVRRLSSLAPDRLKSLTVIFIEEPGRILALSQDIARELGFKEAPSP
jgi:hypothetical protein